MLGGATVTVLAFFFPPDGFLANWIQWLRNESAKLWAAVEQADRDIAQARQALDQARQEHQRLVEVLQSRRHRLMTTDWRSLRGHPFEDFLQEVFEELGYAVQRTKTTGDQGVDLMVERDGVKVAVQAKGYAQPAGNDAVQQVHTGMAFYKCQRCVVITNSGFTPAAQELAVQIGCMLIDGSQIPALLEGRISV
jgi:HJR/Mrr/RecB family endonuclease